VVLLHGTSKIKKNKGRYRILADHPSGKISAGMILARGGVSVVIIHCGLIFASKNLKQRRREGRKRLAIVCLTGP